VGDGAFVLLAQAEATLKRLEAAVWDGVPATELRQINEILERGLNNPGGYGRVRQRRSKVATIKGAGRPANERLGIHR
jgi:hypothetical protein